MCVGVFVVCVGVFVVCACVCVSLWVIINVTCSLKINVYVEQKILVYISKESTKTIVSAKQPHDANSLQWQAYKLSGLWSIGGDLV